MKSFTLKIATPERQVLEGEVESLLIRTTEGDVEIMAGHADFISALGIGRARILIKNEKRFAAVSGGFVSVKNGEATVVCTTFEFSDEIDINRAKAAKEKVEATIAAKKEGSIEALLKAKLARATARINAWELSK